MAIRIVSFEGVTASVGDMDISSIIEFNLSATANSIPMITLLVDASHPGALKEGESQYVGLVSMDAMGSLLTTLRTMVKQPGSTLTININCVDNAGEAQTLSLSEWMLVDVGPSPIQRGGVSAVGLSFMHPLCEAHFGGAVPSLTSTEPKLGDITGSDPLSAFISAITVYANLGRNSPLPATVEGAVEPSTMRDKLISQLTTTTAALSKHLTWSGTGLPAQSKLDTTLICMGFSTYAQPAGGVSLFQMFSGYVVPECSLAIGGDYTQSTLTVKPFTPWEAAGITLYDSDIISLRFPQHDPSPISGVKIKMGATYTERGASYQPKTDQIPMSGTPGEAFYVPSTELDKPFMYGPIYHYSEPGWLVTAASYAKSRTAAPTSDAGSSKDGNLEMATTVERGAVASFGGAGDDNESLSLNYTAAVMQCAKAFFETSFTKDWSFTVTCRLLFSSAGTVLCPGKVLAVKSSSGEVLAGYITNVEHSVSVSSRSAVTRITCTHPRFGGVIPEQVAGSGSSNALYS